MSTENQFYDSFYARSDFNTNLSAEKNFINKILIPLSGWQDNSIVYELGAGRCHQAEMLRQSGYDVTAIEASPNAVKKAHDQYPDLKAICADCIEYKPKVKGNVYARGLSFYHYELDAVNSRGVDIVQVTDYIMETYVVKYGTFVMQIITDFSGDQPNGKVHMNKLEDYIKLFTRFGRVKTYDWRGRPVQKGSRGVIVVTTKT
jgi:hypothetical protein